MAGERRRYALTRPCISGRPTCPLHAPAAVSPSRATTRALPQGESQDGALRAVCLRDLDHKATWHFPLTRGVLKAKPSHEGGGRGTQNRTIAGLRVGRSGSRV